MRLSNLFFDVANEEHVDLNRRSRLGFLGLYLYIHIYSLKINKFPTSVFMTFSKTQSGNGKVQLPQ